MVWTEGCVCCVASPRPQDDEPEKGERGDDGEAEADDADEYLYWGSYNNTLQNDSVGESEADLSGAREGWPGAYL